MNLAEALKGATGLARVKIIEQMMLVKHPKLRHLTTIGNFRAKCAMICHNMEGLGHQIEVFETIRTVARQRELVRKGASKTMNSKHLPGPDGKARAMDVIHKTQKWGAPETFWRTLGRLALMQGCHWGGLFGLPADHRRQFVSWLTDTSKPFDPTTWNRGRGWDAVHIEQK